MSILQGSVYPATLTSPTALTGSTVALTVTAPDGTTSTPTITVASPTAYANVPATQVGSYLLVWTVTGTASTFVLQDQFTVEAAVLDLVSLPDLRNELNIADTSKDVKLRRWLKAATHVVENVTGPIRAQPRTDVFDGAREFVVLPYRWVQSITSIVETVGTVNYTLTEQPLGASVNAYGYTWDRTVNKIVRRTWGGSPAYFPPGIDVVSVAYILGMATIPDDIQLATAELIKHWYRKSETPFRSNAATPFSAQSADDIGMEIVGNYMIPNAVMELLTPWRRRPGTF